MQDLDTLITEAMRDHDMSEPDVEPILRWMQTLPASTSGRRSRRAPLLVAAAVAVIVVAVVLTTVIGRGSGRVDQAQVPPASTVNFTPSMTQTHSAASPLVTTHGGAPPTIATQSGTIPTSATVPSWSYTECAGVATRIAPMSAIKVDARIVPSDGQSPPGLVLTNRSEKTISGIEGHPQIYLLDKAGRVVSQSGTTMDLRPPTTLQAGAAATIPFTTLVNRCPVNGRLQYPPAGTYQAIIVISVGTDRYRTNQFTVHASPKTGIALPGS